MVKNIIKKSEYKEVTPIFKRKEVQYYLLRINPQEVDNELYSVIEDVYDHNPTKNDKTELYNNWLNMEKRVKINNIISYDISENVNSFKVNGISTWLDKSTRVGLNNSLNIEKNNGHTTTVLYLNNIAITLSIDKALEILSNIEMYAIDCYRTTEMHKTNVNNLDVIENVELYDYTDGYPDKLEFNV